MKIQNTNLIYNEPSWRIIAWQHVSFAITKSYFFVTRSSIHTPTEWSTKPNKNYIIAANHIRPFDPFVVTTALGWKRLRPLMPCRFITATKFLHNKFLRTLLRQLGSYPSHQFKDWAYGIEASKELLHQKNTVVIFPQGKMTTKPELPAKWGVSALASQPQTLTIPVYIKKNSFLLKGYDIVVGKPFDGSEMNAQEITDHIYSLA